MGVCLNVLRVCGGLDLNRPGHWSVSTWPVAAAEYQTRRAAAANWAVSVIIMNPVAAFWCGVLLPLSGSCVCTRAWVRAGGRCLAGWPAGLPNSVVVQAALENSSCFYSVPQPSMAGQLWPCTLARDLCATSDLFPAEPRGALQVLEAALSLAFTARHQEQRLTHSDQEKKKFWPGRAAVLSQSEQST